MNHRVDLSKFDNSWYYPGKSFFVRGLWYVILVIFFLQPLFPFYGLKRWLLRLFGAKIGKGVVIKPKVYIKYPWKLEVGDYSWIGEEVRIDNIGFVRMGSHVCISQRAHLLCGNHNYQSPFFDLMVENITVEDGAWIGANSVVCPGSVLKEHAVLFAGSVFSGKSEPYGIYQGNPAVPIKQRIIQQ